MTRKEIYAKIKSYNLAEEIKSKYNKNYTNMASKDLEDFIDNFELSRKSPTFVTVSNSKDERVGKLIEVLSKKRILLRSEVDYILK